MKIFVSADIEGVSGVATWDQAATDRVDYPRARAWMTEDVNAAVGGAFEGGASEVLVHDAHGRARNILAEALDPRARLITGWGPTADMLLGLDASFGLVLLIGYHPGPAIAGGVLSHTFTSRIRNLRLNGLPCNEAVVAALQAGALGVPVGLVTGQLELEAEIRPAMPRALFVSTKRGLAYQAAVLEPLAAARERIRESTLAAVRAAMTGAGPEPFAPASPLVLEMNLTTAEAAAALDRIDGWERLATTDGRLTAPDAPTMIRRFFLALQVLYAVKDSA